MKHFQRVILIDGMKFTDRLWFDTADDAEAALREIPKQDGETHRLVERIERRRIGCGVWTSEANYERQA